MNRKVRRSSARARHVFDVRSGDMGSKDEEVKRKHTSQGWRSDFEAPHDFAGVHPGLDQLQSDTAAYRLFLLRPPDLAHAAFADSVQQVIPANHRPCGLTSVRGSGRPQKARGVLGQGIATNEGQQQSNTGLRLFLCMEQSRLSLFSARYILKIYTKELQ